MTELQQRLDAMQALIAGPFVIVIIVIITSAVLIAAYTERSGRR